MIVVVARPTSSGFSYTIAPGGGKAASTDFTWEAVEILREFGVQEASGPIEEAQRRGAAILRGGSEDGPAATRVPRIASGGHYAVVNPMRGVTSAAADQNAPGPPEVGIGRSGRI